MLEYASTKEQLQFDLAKARLSNCLYWVETKFDWRPKAFYQELLLGCFDNVYTYPQDYHDQKLAGKPITKFAWRIGRQSGKTESLALGALYLAFCRPITKHRWRNYKDPVTREWKSEQIPYKNGANIIVASADAGKAKIIYDRAMQYLTRNKVYNQMINEDIIKIRQQPYFTITITSEGWKEPAVISFRGPGAKGQALRGSTFDYKLYDEADYFPSSFFEAEKATTINADEEAGLTILSSTPSGRRDHFFKACFPAGQKVIMGSGNHKPIEEVQVGDAVVNRWGDVEYVGAVKQRTYKRRLVSFISTLNNEVVTSTANHKFMALRKKERYCKACMRYIWEEQTTCFMSGTHNLGPVEPKYVEAKKLRVGDMVAVPKDWCPQLEDGSFYHRVGKFVYFPITEHTISEPVEPITVYNLTVGEDHSYLVNYYGVENCTDARWGYKEFWFSSWENPKYTEKMDYEFQQELLDTGYVHEILADWGDTENGVFSWQHFKSVFEYPYKNVGQDREYRRINITASEINAITPNKLAAHYSRKFPRRLPGAKYWFGADLGFSADPSEFVVFEEWNGEMKLVLRIHMEHVTYDIQQELICAMDDYYSFGLLGIDAGNVGTSLIQNLQSKRNARYSKYKFDKRIVAIPFGGRILIGYLHGKEIKENSKLAMTNFVNYHAQEGLLHLPGLKYDDDLENQFRNHTYSHGQGGNIIYAKSSIFGDHAIDAIRCAFYVKSYASFGRNVGRSFTVGRTFRAGQW